MGKKRSGGYIFVTYKGDHSPLHVHIEQTEREIGRWDVENQKPMDGLEISNKLRKALKKKGYIFEEESK